jgi:hypothetical protein
MVVRNRFVRAARPSDALSCSCGSAGFKLGTENVRLEEIGDRIYIARGEGVARTVTPLDGIVRCANDACGKTYDRLSAWDER